MRVIAGIHRRRTLLGPEGNNVTRPITDRVKQSLFDRLTVMGVFEEGSAVDIYSGTGSLGIEALSRGVEHCIFVERDRTALKRLRQNLDTLGIADKASILDIDAMSTHWLKQLDARQVGILFCDPPYQQSREPMTRDRLSDMLSEAADHVTSHAVLSLRTESSVEPLKINRWQPPQTHEYRSMAVHLYER